MELGSLQLHSPTMRGFKQTKSLPRKPAGFVQEGWLPRPNLCVCVGVGGGVNGVCFFLRVSSKQTTTWRGQKQVEATGAAAAAWAALLVDCSWRLRRLSSGMVVRQRSALRKLVSPPCSFSHPSAFPGQEGSYCLSNV